MNIVLIGIQGCGKGTLVLDLQKHIDFNLVSVGQLLRNEIASNSNLGKKLKTKLDAGNFADLKTVLTLVKNNIKSNTKPVLIFDGFPRNIEQMKALKKICKIDLVLYLNLSKDEALKRILSRLTCQNCGYITKKQEVKSNLCPVCSGKLSTRSDDTIEAIEKRFKTYEEVTKPVIDEYRKQNIVVEINANQSQNKVFEDAMKVLSDYNKKQTRN